MGNAPQRVLWDQIHLIFSPAWQNRIRREEQTEQLRLQFAAKLGPNDFAEVERIKDWLANNYDWYEETVYFDQEWIDGETQVFDLMKETGYIEEGTENPEFVPITPEEGEAAAAGEEASE